MADDLTLAYLNRLRSLNQHSVVNDMQLLDIALRLGAVDDDMKPHYASYRPLLQVSDEQLEQMVDDLAIGLEAERVNPGEAVGITTAHSISEPITQATMRTFHYAGVLTKVSPLIRLNTDVSMSNPDFINLAIAFKPPYNKDYDFVKEFAYKLSRTKLRNMDVLRETDEIGVDGKPGKVNVPSVIVARDNMEFREHKIAKEMSAVQAEIDNYSGNKFRPYTPQEAAIKLPIFQKMGLPLPELSNEYTPEYQSLIDRKAQVYREGVEQSLQVGKNNTFIVYLLKDAPITPGQLFKAVFLQFKEGDGSYRTYGKQPTLSEPNPLYEIFKNASIEPFETEYNGEEAYALMVNFPGLPSRLFQGLMDEMMNIEICNNCKHPTTLAKLINSKKAKTSEKIDASEWDDSAPIDSYYEKVIQVLKESGIQQNPPDEEEDTTGIIEIDTSELDKLIFGTADNTEHKRCRNCDHGWLHFNYGKESQNLMVGPVAVDEDGGFVEKMQYSVMTNRGLSPNNDSFTSLEGKPTAGFNDRFTIKADDKFVYPGLGASIGMSAIGYGISDYPLQHTEDGSWIAEPQDGEYYIIATISNDERIGSRKSGYIGQGGWLRAVKTFSGMYGILDFDRTTCNDVRQVENVLGIEAARTVLFHNLMKTITDAGETHLKHALLLSDAMCAHNSVKTAPAGRGSIVGMNSQMGNRTEVMSDGEILNYGSVLAQAYERQVQVVLDRSIVGMIDDLRHPKSSAIVGVPPRFGTLGDNTEGKYSAPELDDALRHYVDFATGKPNGKQRLDELLSMTSNANLLLTINKYFSMLEEEMNRLCLEQTSFTWTGDNGLWHEIPVQYKLPVHELQRSKRSQILSNKEFADLFEHYGVIRELNEYIISFMRID